MQRLPQERRTAVYSAAGDRRDEDLLAQGRLLAATFDRVVIYEDAYIRGREPGDITRILSEGIRQGMRADRPTTIESGGNWEQSAALVLDAVTAGDLVLLQPDTIEQTMPWLAARYGQRLRETNFDEIAGLAIHENQDRSPGPHEPVEVRNSRLGRGVCATRAILAGETILTTWGRKLAKRSRHSMQVAADTHILPDGVTVLFNHSCEPNCGVVIRAGEKRLEVRALKPIAAGEELTFDYDTFEYEVEHLKSPCLCGAAKCRGRVAGYKHLPADVKARYGEFIADYLRILDAEVSAPVSA
jgi:hypothetical protein